MVLAARDATRTGPASNVIFRALLHAHSATRLTNRTVHCAKKIFTVIAVNILAVRGVLLETKAKRAIKVMVPARLTARTDCGVFVVTNNVGRVAVVMFATEQRVNA